MWLAISTIIVQLSFFAITGLAMFVVLTPFLLNVMAWVLQALSKRCSAPIGSSIAQCEGSVEAAGKSFPNDKACLIKARAFQYGKGLHSNGLRILSFREIGTRMLML